MTAFGFFLLDDETITLNKVDQKKKIRLDKRMWQSMSPLRQLKKMPEKVVMCQRIAAIVTFDSFTEFLSNYKCIFKLFKNNTEQQHAVSTLPLLLARPPAREMKMGKGKLKEAREQDKVQIGQQQQLAECALPLLLAKGSARKQSEGAARLVIDLLEIGGSSKVEINTLLPKNKALHLLAVIIAPEVNKFLAN